MQNFPLKILKTGFPYAVLSKYLILLNNKIEAWSSYVQHTNPEYVDKGDSVSGSSINLSSWGWHEWFKNTTSTEKKVQIQVQGVSTPFSFSVLPGQAYIVSENKTKPIVVDVSGGAGSYYIITGYKREEGTDGSLDKIIVTWTLKPKATDLYGENVFITTPLVVGSRYFFDNGENTNSLLDLDSADPGFNSLRTEGNNAYYQIKTRYNTADPSTSISASVFQGAGLIDVDVLYKPGENNGYEECFFDVKQTNKIQNTNNFINHVVHLDFKDNDFINLKVVGNLW